MNHSSLAILASIIHYCSIFTPLPAQDFLPDTTTSPQPVVAAQPETLVSIYHNIAGQIMTTALADSFAYQRLAVLVDTFGPRFSGTTNLEDAIDWILAQMKADSLDNVRGEEVTVPQWVRGEESAELLIPHERKLHFIGLGGSVGTVRRGITAEALVVSSFSDLENRANQAWGRIVVYNAPFTSYDETVTYYRTGAVAAAKAGAVASLVRSVTPNSMNLPHTGSMSYEDGVRKIPYGAITVEDALQLQRFQDRGQKIIINLKMGAHYRSDLPSRNVVAEIVGREKPEEIVVIGGHIDSWDIGQGAIDDGGGCVAAWETLRLLRRLDLTPRRTIRVVLWTNEENGLRGALAYRDTHTDELDNHILAIESDAGVFQPQGFGFSGSQEALALLRDIAALLEPIGADTITDKVRGADIGPIMQQGVPGMGLNVDSTRYFWYHHTDADTIDKLNPHELNLCVAALAVMAYAVADMPERLPR